MMTQMAVVCLSMLLFAVIMGLFRIVRGPTVIDRILGLDTVAVSAVATVVLASAYFETLMFVDLLLAISLLIFFSTSALVFYIARFLKLPRRDVPEILATLSKPDAQGPRDDEFH